MLQRELRALAERQGEVRGQLTGDEQRRQNQQALFAEIAAQEGACDLWQRLNGLIGSADGAKYRRFAQGLTLDHLIHLANQQLERLHGRYQLRRRALGELELEVVDTWQADAARDCRTLSGGESFLVSLALALALSDLVSHKTSIDSLFLDEGFGTLDGETLEVALDALDALNASGKMIGVISHVEALRSASRCSSRCTRAWAWATADWMRASPCDGSGGVARAQRNPCGDGTAARSATEVAPTERCLPRSHQALVEELFVGWASAHAVLVLVG